MLSEKRPGKTAARTMDERTSVGHLKNLLKNGRELYNEMNLLQRLLSPQIKNRNEALELAIDALEKQIPKKVLESKCHECQKDCVDCEDDTDRCPNCKESIANDFDYEYKFCPECGQALDWGVEE